MAPTARGRKRNTNAEPAVPAFSATATATATATSSKINLDEYEEVEDEYGFRYMRKKQKLTPVAVAVNGTPMLLSASNYNTYAPSPSTPTPSKQVLENNRRKRRSSFAVMAAQNQAARASSIGVSLTHNLPPDNVRTGEYHKHLLPDLPGPVKMRQLLIWACQKAAVQLSRGSALNSLGDLSEDLVQALFKNDIPTSWYQRPSVLQGGMANNGGSPHDSDLFHIPNPQNQELSECIDLYRNYQEKLKAECRVWETIVAESGKRDVRAALQQQPVSENAPPRENSLNGLFAEESGQLAKWISGLPLGAERLDWTTKLAISFQDHSKQFCEGVFHQIFAKFFAGDLQPTQQRVEPMMVLRAMSHPALPDSPIHYRK